MTEDPSRAAAEVSISRLTLSVKERIRVAGLYVTMAAEQKIVVVAEDEVVIRMVTAEILGDAGFEVVEAEHAERALQILRDRGGQVHLLFTDVHMSGPMSGLDLAHNVRRIWPHIALMIASGQGLPGCGELPAGSIFLSKPYDWDRLVAHARHLTAA